MWCLDEVEVLRRRRAVVDRHVVDGLARVAERARGHVVRADRQQHAVVAGRVRGHRPVRRARRLNGRALEEVATARARSLQGARRTERRTSAPGAEMFGLMPLSTCEGPRLEKKAMLWLMSNAPTP